MGIIKSGFDYFGMNETPNMILCKPNKDPICSLAFLTGRSVTLRLNDISILSFKLYQTQENKGTYDKIISNRLVYVTDFMFFRIDMVKEVDDGAQSYKEVTCHSLEVELTYKKVNMISDTYVFFNPINPQDEGSLLGQVFKDLPNWSIAYVDPLLWNQYRHFDISDDTIYNFLMSTVSTTLECIFRYDTLNRTVSVFSGEMVVKPTELFLSHENLLTETTVQDLTDERFTAMQVLGAGNLSVAMVNPLGSNYVYNFDPFMTEEWMSLNLIHALKRWKENLAIQKPIHSSLMQNYASNNLILYGNPAISLDTGLYGELGILKNDLKVLEVKQSNDIQMGKGSNSEEYLHLHQCMEDVAHIDWNPGGILTSLTGFSDKIVLSYSNKEPYIFASHKGDLWIDTSQDLMTIYQNHDNSWVLTKDPVLLQLVQVIGFHKKYNYANTVFFQPTPPTAGQFTVGDCWVNPSTKAIKQSMYRKLWRKRTIEKKSAASISGGKSFISVYFTATQPTAGSNGDVWAKLQREGGFSYEKLFLKQSGVWSELLLSSENYDALNKLVADIPSSSIVNQVSKIYFSTAAPNLSLAHVGELWLDLLHLGTVNVLITSKKAELYEKQSEIDGYTIKETATVMGDFSNKQIADRLREIAKALAFSNPTNFTPLEYKELSYYIIETSYQDENFIQTDTMSPVEVQKMSQDLYDQAEKILNRIVQPRFSFDLRSLNFMFMEKFAPFASQLDLGSSVTVALQEDLIYHPVLLEINLNYDDPNDFSMTFGNRLRLDRSEFIFSDLFGKSITTGNKVSIESGNWSNWSNHYKDEVSEFLKSSLDASKNSIIASANQSFILDGVGLRGKRFDNGQYGQEEIWINNSTIAFTKDGWNNSSLALGKLPNGSYGLVADTIVGKLLAGNQLSITNENNNFLLDSKGAMLNNASFTLSSKDGLAKIVLDPNGEQSILIQTKKTPSAPFESKFYVDSAGNLIMKGNLEASVIRGSHFLSGNTSGVGNESYPVNINNNFKVDASGNLFSNGVLSAKDIVMTKGTLRNGAILGSTIDIGEIGSDGKGKFSVDSAGNVRLNGNITWGTPLIQYEYSANNFSWHKVQGTGDIYRRDSTDFGRSWGVGYQFIGVNGSNGSDGSDANVPRYITQTGITKTTITAPKITGALIEGGAFKVTGSILSDYTGRSEFGIYDESNQPYGFIRYDHNKNVTGDDNPKRMLISTVDKKAMKIQSDGNLSIDAGGEDKGGIVYFGSNVTFEKPPKGVYAMFK